MLKLEMNNEEVYENEKWVGGKWISHHSIPWSNHLNEPSPSRDEICIKNDDFHWDGDWRVEQRTGITGKYGWEYATKQDEFKTSKGRRLFCFIISIIDRCAIIN